MKYKHLPPNLKSKFLILKAWSLLCRWLGTLCKYPSSSKCNTHLPVCQSGPPNRRLQARISGRAFGQVLPKFLNSGLLVVRMLSVFGLLVLSISLSSCTGATVEEASLSPVSERQPSKELSSAPVSDETQAKVSISDLVIKEAKIIHVEKPRNCGITGESNIALFLVYNYNITWTYPKPVKEIQLPYNPQKITVESHDGNYLTSDQDKLSEVESHTSSLTTTGDTTESRSIKLTLGAICKSIEIKLPSIPGLTNSGSVGGRYEMISPQPGKFTLTLSVDGQQLSKEFVAQ